MIDLHVHTCYSDGEHTPAEIIKIAKKSGLTAIAITDHDSIKGVKEAVIKGKEEDILVIPGIEITAFEEEEVHVLGYNIDIESEEISSYVDKVFLEREQETSRIFEYLNFKGIKLTQDDVYKYRDGEIVTIWHFARALNEKGYAESINSALDTFFYNTPLNYLSNERISVKDAIYLINQAGGVAVLAHPGRLSFSYDTLLEKLNSWKEAGISGLEAIYSLNSDEENEKFLKLAEDMNLGFTIGTDYHGENVKPKIFMGKGINESMLIYKDLTIDDISILIK